MIRKLALILVGILIVFALSPLQSVNAAGISASGGGSNPVGKAFTVRVVASGAEFDSLQGTISVSGPVKVSGFAAGGATWLPGKAPANGGQFVGITSPTSSLTVASITLVGTKEGKGSVSVSGVSLARNGSYVGSNGGSTGFTIVRAPTPPGQITVSSSTHPDPNQEYEATTVTLSWTPPANGADGYAYVFDDTADTNPASTSLGKETTKTYDNVAVGIHYFHLKAHNGDGWGSPVHFKVTIKEPETKIDESLSAPIISSVTKNGNAVNDIDKGTLAGITIKGSGALSDYLIVLSVDPKDRLPAEVTASLIIPPASPTDTPTADTTTTKTPTAPTFPYTDWTKPINITPLVAIPDAQGNWNINLSQPLPVGFYKITAQSQKDKTLTPKSNEVKIEISVANGGTVRLISNDDLKGKTGSDGIMVLGWKFSRPNFYILIGILIVLLATGTWVIIYSIRKRRRTRGDTNRKPESPTPRLN